MAVEMGDTLATRDAFRRAITADIVGRAELAAVPYEGEGPLAGVDVISVRRLEQVILEHLAVPLPPPSEHHAEVTAPATITITNICPECELPVKTSTKATSILIASKEEGSEVKTKLKTKPAPHVCGQLQLDEAAADAEAQAAKVARNQLVAFPGGEGAEVDDLRIRVLRTIADLEDRWADAGDSTTAQRPTLLAIAEAMEVVGESDIGDLEESLYAYSQDETPFVEVIREPDAPVYYGLTEAGIAKVAEADAAAADPAPAPDAELPGFMLDADPDPVAATADDAVAKAQAEMAEVDTSVQCVGSNHVPGCEHHPDVPKRGKRTPGDA